MNAVLSWDATPEALEALSVLQFSAPALAFPEANRSPPTEAIASVEHPLLPAGSDQHTLEAAQAISARLQSAAQAVDLVAAELSEVIQLLQNAKEEKDAVLQRNRSVEHTCRALWDGEAESNSFVVQAQALLDQFAAIESCLRDFVAFRKSGTADDAQLLLLLDRVADGLAFVEKWPTFKETAVYSGRLKQLSQWCVSAVCKRVAAAFDSAAPPPAASPPSDITAADPVLQTLLMAAAAVAPLIQGISSRAEAGSSPSGVVDMTSTGNSGRAALFQSIHSDVTRSFAASRAKAVHPRLLAAFSAGTGVDLAQAWSGGWALLLQMCDGEISLYTAAFKCSPSAATVKQLLNPIGDAAASWLKERSVACSDVFALCDVMDALQRAAHSLHRDASTAAAATLAETIRQGCKDVQSRAVFLAQRHIASHLSSAAVATEDLNYPECLLAQESHSSSHAESSAHSAPAPSSVTEGVNRGSVHVFPVLAASLTFLRKIEIAVETPVFERLVGEVLQEACSLIRSSQLAISTRSGKIHGLLFACRCLLQLREATQGIDAAPCVPQASVDFSNLWGVFKDWWRHHGPLFSLSGENAFYQLWQQAVPRVTVVEDDARRAVDAQLKTACECLIFDVSHQLSAPVMMLHAQMESATPLAVDAEVMKQALAATHDAIVEDGASAVALVSTYIPNRVTQSVLLHPIRNNITSSVRRLADAALAQGLSVDVEKVEEVLQAVQRVLAN